MLFEALIISRYQRFVCGWRASRTVAASSYRASDHCLFARLWSRRFGRLAPQLDITQKNGLKPKST